MIGNFIPIWYSLGMRGNAIYRILSSHPEAYVHNTNLLDIDSLVTNLTISEIDNNILGSKTSSWILSYATYHTTSIFYGNEFNKIMLRWLTDNKNKLLFSCVHPPMNNMQYGDKAYLVNHNQANRGVKITDKQFKLLDKHKPHVWVHGTRDRFNMPIMRYYPSTNPLAYNLNVDALFSKDYITFETEYFKLINHFSFTSCLNAVRAFILLVLEREDYTSKF